MILGQGMAVIISVSASVWPGHWVDEVDEEFVVWR
jgi:hypothetical protein